jgi:hypothetical protein
MNLASTVLVSSPADISHVKPKNIILDRKKAQMEMGKIVPKEFSAIN